MQSLNADINNRYVKIEFLRDILTDNQLDMIYLIDVNDTKALMLNGYKKYEDGRNVLFVKDEFMIDFVVSKNCIFSDYCQIGFVYLTPSSTDVTLMNNILTLIKHKYVVIGDINYKSNKILQGLIPHFAGEDSLQTGFIANKAIKVNSVAAPSDHRFVIGEWKIRAKLMRSLKLKEVAFDESKERIFDILNGKMPSYTPKITMPQYFVGLNDREKTINALIDDYFNNNTRKMFKKYNFLWKFDRREPFLGKHVPVKVQSSYAEHLREDKNKEYLDIQPIKNVDMIWVENLKVKITKSAAINHEFISLKSITKAMNEYLFNPENHDKDIINNIIKVANESKNDLNAEVFFLQKNRIINDFNDVRVIMIVPTLIKIYESIIFSKVMTYLSDFLSSFDYQYGGIISGSTYKAMLKVKLLQSQQDNNGIILFDLAKGYDTVNLTLLKDCIGLIRDDNLRQLLLVWLILIKNMDVVVNGIKIKRTRGIPMGLSLSPVIFVYYVHNALWKVKKENIAMYIDDLALVLFKKEPQAILNEINAIILALRDFDLVVNEKKTKFDTKDGELANLLSGRFTKFESYKYLGRLIAVNGDGKVTADDRFVNLKGNRTNAMVFWCTFFVKRIVYNAALDAKLRYRLLMWSTTSKSIKTAVWRNHWFFFKKSMNAYSYLQLHFSIFNIFRYFIDIMDVIQWRKEKKEGTKDDETLRKEIIGKLETDIPQVNDAVARIAVDWSDVNSDKNDFEFTKCFINRLWESFKSAAVGLYKEKKKGEHTVCYSKVNEFCNSRLFKCFGILQLVIFLHFMKDNKKTRRKDAFVLYSLLGLLKALEETVVEVFFNNKEIESVDNFSIDYIIDKVKVDLSDDLIKTMPNVLWNEWRDWFCFDKLWALVDLLLKIFDAAKIKGRSEVNVEEQISKFEYVAFVDGAFNSKDKKVGYGWIIKKNNSIIIENNNGCLENPEEIDLKNIAGELYATIEAVDRAIELNLKKIVIVYDYYGIYKYYSGEWMSENAYIKSYVIRMRQFAKLIDIQFFKVASHTGIVGNDDADRLAKHGANIVVHYNNNSDKRKYERRISQVKIDYLKNATKIIFKYLTIIEMSFLNSNLNGLSLDYLIMNAHIKSINLDAILEKNYKLFELDDNLDPMEDRIYDVVND